MPNLSDPPPPDNPKVDPLLAFVCRAQARATLWANGVLELEEALDPIFTEGCDVLTREEALAIVQAAFRQAKRRVQGLIP